MISKRTFHIPARRRAFRLMLLAWSLGAFLSLCNRAAAASPAAETALKAGYGQVDITPPLGVSMPGYFQVREASGVLDPLLAKALVLTKGETTLAIIALDLIGVQADVVAAIREAVRAETGIPSGHVFVHATHTHTGANVSAIRDKLPGQAAAAVKQACAAQVSESRVALGSCPEPSVAFIRRYLMKDGTVRTNPGRGNPDIVRAMGEIDPNVYVLSFQKARTLLVSYGLHPDCVSGTQFSADYPGHLTTAVRESLGADWNVIYLNACCGNVNHINVKNTGQRSSPEESQRIGRTLARAALTAHRNGALISVDRLGARTQAVQCPVRKVPKDVYDWAKRQMEENPEEASKRKFNEPTPSRIIALAETKETTREAEVIAVRIGPVGLVGLPAELFVEGGRDIKRHSLFDPTLVIGLTGGTMGYVPHPRGYDEGGYEATYASARLAPETPILWSDTAGRLLKELADQEGPSK